MHTSSPAFQEIIDFVSHQNAYIKKIAHRFMNVIGLNYFGAAIIQHRHKNILSVLNTDISRALFWLEQGLPLPILLPNGFYFASQFKTLFPESVLKVIREKYEADHILFYVRHNLDNTRVFSYASAPENPCALSNYLNYSQEILNFQTFFLQETKKLRKESQNRSFEYDFSIPSQKKIFPHELPIINCNGFGSIYDVIEVLSYRELECLKLRFRGMSMKSIAQKLDLRISTIESYLDSTKNKLSCHTRNEMMDLYQALTVERPPAIIR